MDEVSLAAETSVMHVQYGMITQLHWTPSSFGLQSIRNEDLLVDGPEASAAMIRSVFQGQAGAARDIVLANASAGLWIAGRTHSLIEGVAMAAKAIDSGSALRLLEALSRSTQAVSE
jgi:anthranilate phosphoribosyltransferase